MTEKEKTAAQRDSDDKGPGVGPILRRLRHEKGWSLQELAEKSGVSVGMISQIERDLANPSVRVLTAIRRALQAPVSAVFRDVAPTHAEDPAEPDFVRRADQRPLLELGALRKELLTSSGHHSLQMMVLHINPGGHSGNTALSYPAEKGGPPQGGGQLRLRQCAGTQLQQPHQQTHAGNVDHRRCATGPPSVVPGRKMHTMRHSLPLRLDQVSKSFGAVQALAPLSLDVKPGERMALLGPSGCGKTTTLRIVAGFSKPDTGSLHIGDRDVTELPPHKPGLGMVFQKQP
jgi:transcriptional regulator with XRE-family HTH domain